jgi:hypothetical protein
MQLEILIPIMIMGGMLITQKLLKTLNGTQMESKAQKLVDATMHLTLRPQQEDRAKVIAAVFQHLIDEHREVKGTGRVDKEHQIVSVKTLMGLIEELENL